MSAGDAFVPLADLLRSPAVLEDGSSQIGAASRIDAGSQRDGASEMTAAAVSPPEPQSEPLPAPEIVAAIREARLFRARLADALDAKLERLLAGIASEIVLRELRSAPAEIASIVAFIIQEYGAPPLCIRVAPADADALRPSDVRVVEDSTLDAGDAIVVFGTGEIDARLGVRLAAVLEALR